MLSLSRSLLIPTSNPKRKVSMIYPNILEWSVAHALHGGDDHVGHESHENVARLDDLKHVYIYHTWEKNFKNDGNQKIILADKANFSFDFGLILAILRRFLPLSIVFSLITTASSCKDADFFTGMMYI